MIRCISMYEVGMEALTTPNSADDDAARRRLAFIIAKAKGEVGVKAVADLE